ncbi:ATP-binding protein [Tropicimonas sp. TH_r6]|uniref:ATP-binding protein n=1 Tax=Tropicimonas sp. TH_r6 TaxID=3082085 RepID=UPI0029554455|nr:ATP-binding protein [Tropicimonas sp. TH_r6]MDV7143001.1 ATP-binding protein [Tropicimonas sp. TH_r6]
MRRFLPVSLRGQLLLLILLTLALAQGLAAWLFADERELAVRAALGQEAASRAANVARLIVEAPEELRDSILRAANSPLVRFTLDREPAVDHFNHDGGGIIADQIADQVGTTPPPEVRVELHQTSEAMPPMAGMPSDMARRHMAMMDMQISSVEMTIAVAMGDNSWLNVTTRFHHPPYQVGWTALATFGVTSFLIAITLWFALGQLTGPLRELARSAEQFGRGEDVPDIAPSGPEELRSLTRAFNQMQTRIRRFVDDRTKLLAALSHDLRSPLTALRVRAELVDEEETRERIIATTEEMQEMVESTLAFARGVTDTEPVETVDLNAFLSDLVSELQETTTAIELKTSPEAVSARLRPTSMRRALRNVIENAVRYGQHAEIRLETREGNAVVVVEDQGPGIPAEELDRVFDPFVRLEQSRSRETGGTGLGLSTARTITQSHGGDISLENRAGGGLSACVTLPAT